MYNIYIHGTGRFGTAGDLKEAASTAWLAGSQSGGSRVVIDDANGEEVWSGRGSRLGAMTESHAVETILRDLAERPE